MQKPKVRHPSPVDGINRKPDLEKRLNEAFAYCFRGKTGALALDYLQSITINRIRGPGIPPDELLHLEGSRYLYGIIKARVNRGKDKRHAPDDDE